MTVELLTADEVARGLIVKRCKDGHIRIAKVGMTGEGENATAALGWYRPKTRDDYRQVRLFVRNERKND